MNECGFQTGPRCDDPECNRRPAEKPKEFIIDTCISVNADTLQDANTLSEIVKKSLMGAARAEGLPLTNVHVCHIEQVES